MECKDAPPTDAGPDVPLDAAGPSTPIEILPNGRVRIDAARWLEQQPKKPPEPPGTFAELRRKIAFYRSLYTAIGEGALYRSFAVGDIAELWSYARTIPGAPPPPAMPEAFAGEQETKLHEFLEALDILLRWCDEIEGRPPDENEIERGHLGFLPPEARAIMMIRDKIKTAGKLPTKTAIAKELEVDRRTLNNWKAFKIAYAELKASLKRSLLPRGHKTKDGDLEAWRGSGK